MSASHRRFGARLLLSAALALTVASAEAATERHRAGHARAAASQHAAPIRGRTDGAKDGAKPATARSEAAVKPVSTDGAASKPASSGRTAAWTSVEGERACFRGRRKLWQDGEGWVVKKVSVCP